MATRLVSAGTTYELRETRDALGILARFELLLLPDVHVALASMQRGEMGDPLVVQFGTTPIPIDMVRRFVEEGERAFGAVQQVPVPADRAKPVVAMPVMNTPQAISYEVPGGEIERGSNPEARAVGQAVIAALVVVLGPFIVMLLLLFASAMK